MALVSNPNPNPTGPSTPAAGPRSTGRWGRSHTSLVRARARVRVRVRVRARVRVRGRGRVRVRVGVRAALARLRWCPPGPG